MLLIAVNIVKARVCRVRFFSFLCMPLSRSQHTLFFSHVCFVRSTAHTVFHACLFRSFPLTSPHRNFTSPHTIRVEAGLSSMMDQYDRNFKVRRVMGSVRQANKAMADAGSTSSRMPERVAPTPESKQKQRNMS